MVIVSLCLSLIIAEVALRAIIPVDNRKPAEFRIPHPVLGWVLEPDASYTYQMPEDTVSVSYNHAGWHDVDHVVSKPDGNFRILVLGDSFMEAYSVDLNDAFHRRVEDFARSDGVDVEVINLGVASYGTLQEYMVFHDIGRLYEPDLVLLGFFDANDVMNNSLELESMLGEGRPQSIARPYLDPNEPDIWVVTPGDYEGIQRHFREERAYLDAQRHKLRERLLILRLPLALINKVRNLVSLKSGESQQELAGRERQELALYGVNYCVEPEEYTKAWETTERILVRLKQEIESIGSKLVVFTVPALEEVNVDTIQKLTTEAVNPQLFCLEDAPGDARLGNILAKHEIEFIDLFPDFKRVLRDNDIQLYRISDQHWSPEGHALAAERVVSELIGRGLLPTPQEQASPTP